MTNDMTKISVADAFKHLRPTQSLGEGITSGFTWIGYHNQKWALRHEGGNKMFTLENGELSPFIDVVIVGMNPNISKMFYHPGTYVEGSANAPVCASLNGDKPDPGVPEPQNEICPTCPNNAWGSGQRKGKACQDHRKLAVLLLPYMTKNMLEKPLLDPIYLKVNPNSLKSLKNYGDSLVHRGAHFATVITRIIWDPKNPWVMQFSVKQPLTDKEAPVILPLLESPLTKSIIGNRVEVYEEEEAPPAPTPRETPVDSGLLDAFSEKPTPAPATQVVKRGPGRPRKVALDQAPAPQQVQQPQQEETAAGNGGNAGRPWDEADPELSETVAKLTSAKMHKMLE